MKTRAAVIYNMGQPVPYANSKPLVIEEVEIESIGPGEVLVEVAGAGLCHSDLSVIDGSRPRFMPMILGHEASGIVREVGPSVQDLKPDDHVVFSFVPMCGRCVPCATGRPALCENGARANLACTLLSGHRRFRNAAGQEVNHHLGVSGFSQYTVVAQESLIKIDPAFPLKKAALFGCAIITGVGAVLNTAKVEPGTGVAIFGMGGVGLSAVLGSKLANAYPIIAVDVLESKLDLARKLGATHTINASAKEIDPVAAIKDLTGGGAHYAFESVGSEQVLIQAYQATRRGGTTVTVGLPASNKQFTISALSLTLEERIVKGSFMGSAVPRRDIPRFIALHEAGLLPIDLLLSRTISLDEIKDGFDALSNGESVRQIIRF
jgi:alcohol dehydrogenase